MKIDQKNRICRRTGMFKKIGIWIAVFTLAVMSFCGCSLSSGESKVIFTTALEKDDIFRIGDSVCKKSEFMVYLTNTQNQYEKVYGDEVCSLSVDGISLEDNLKETVLAKIAQIKTMALLAKQHNVTLSEEKEREIKEAAKTYFTTLSDKEKEVFGVTQEQIAQMYREYALAEAVYERIINTVNPEISDDEARTVTVLHLFLRTCTEDEAGNRTEYSDTLKQNQYEKMKAYRDAVLDGSQNFQEVARQKGDLEEVEEFIGMGEVDPAIEKVVFSLEKNEISDVIQTEEGYHVLKCINTYNEKETEANKLRLIEVRRKEAFGKEYDTFVESLNRVLNEEAFAEITILHEKDITTDRFFEIGMK